MAELARGTVHDRPWGRTLGALALRGLTGQVNVTSDGKVYSVGFHGGAVVGAHSPNMADGAARMALTAGLVSSSQVAEIVKRQMADKNRDEVEVLGEFINLPGDHAMRLRRRAIAQKAARTFALDRGDFVVEDHITVRFVSGSELDIRAIVYLGAKSFLTEARLNRDLGQLGAWYQLKPELHEYLPQFGFGADERPVLEALAEGIGLGELEVPEIDQRMARAMIYTLASCGQLHIEAQPRPPQRRQFRTPTRQPTPHAGMPAAARPPTPHAGVPVASRPATPHAGTPVAQRPQTPPAGAPVAPMPGSTSDRVPVVPHDASKSGPIGTPSSSSSDPVRTPVQRSAQQSAPRARPDTLNQPTFRKADTVPDAGAALDAPTHRVRTPTGAPTMRRPKSPTAQSHDVEKLIRQRLAVLDEGGDHFQLLGIAREANNSHIQKAYFALARQLHPDRLTALGISDENKQAQRLFAQVNTAFSVLANEQKREEYLDILDRGGEAAVRAEQQAAEQMAHRVLESEESFRKGEAALRRDSISVAIKELEHAVSLNPEEPDYVAMLTWAKFCGAGDKMSVGAATRKALRSVIDRAPSNITARFYLGRVERMLGKDRDALALFEEVLELQPHHAEATAEVRVLQSRLGGDKGGGGLFGRLKR